MSSITVNVYHHFGDFLAEHALGRVVSLLEQVVMTQQEHAAELLKVKEQVAKVGAETLRKITDLETALVNAGNTSPEVNEALAALKSQVQLADDVIPDVPTP